MTNDGNIYAKVCVCLYLYLSLFIKYVASKTSRQLHDELRDFRKRQWPIKVQADKRQRHNREVQLHHAICTIIYFHTA